MRHLRVVGGQKTIEIKPLEMFTEGTTMTSTKTEYASENWCKRGIATKFGPFNRYSAMLDSFTAMVRSEKTNPYTLDYELELFKLILKVCGRYDMFEDKVFVYCLKYAESVLPESLVFNGGDAEKQIPISFAIYLIKSKGRNILVDAGCNNMPGFKMNKFYSPVFVLRQMDLSAEDITDVIITHSHHDHIQAVKYFENANVYISKKEYVRGKRYISDNIKVNIFEGEYIINPQIKIVEWSGHSKGSAIVEIKSEDLIHIIAGDECYTNENIDRKICTGSFSNKEQSIKFIEQYCNKEYKVHTCHDISLKTERII